MKNKDKKLDVHINLKITKETFSNIDALRIEYLKEYKDLVSRSEMIRILLEEGIQNRVSV